MNYRLEVEMARYIIEENSKEQDDQIFDWGSQGISKKDNDQPKRSPIRRKYKMRQKERMKSRTKGNHKKDRHRIKYEWQGD